MSVAVEGILLVEEFMRWCITYPASSLLKHLIISTSVSLQDGIRCAINQSQRRRPKCKIPTAPGPLFKGTNLFHFLATVIDTFEMLESLSAWVKCERLGAYLSLPGSKK